MQKLKVAIYGLTTEGYKLASRLADRSEVTVVDETLQMAMELNPGIPKSHPNLDELMSGEPLMGLKPVSQVLEDADVVFFTPKLRRPLDELLVEAGSKMRDVAKSISKDSTVVNTLPTGPGGNAENVMALEKQTGLTVGDSLGYAYMPLQPRSAEPNLMASVVGKGEKQPLELLGFKPNSQNVFAAELSYASTVLVEAVKMASEIELMKRAREARVKSVVVADSYLDSFAPHMFELKAIQSSDDAGESIAYLAGAALKSFENYVRYAVDEAREILKDLELKASRTRIILLWTLDRHEMRADRIQMADSVVQRLRDYVSDVNTVSSRALMSSSNAFDSQKHNLVIACSDEDYQQANQAKKRQRGGEFSILHATPSLRRE